MCVLTVVNEMYNLSAISLLLNPSLIRFSTSISLFDSKLLKSDGFFSFEIVVHSERIRCLCLFISNFNHVRIVKNTSKSSNAGMTGYFCQNHKKCDPRNEKPIAKNAIPTLIASNIFCFPFADMNSIMFGQLFCLSRDQLL